MLEQDFFPLWAALIRSILLQETSLYIIIHRQPEQKTEYIR